MRYIFNLLLLCNFSLFAQFTFPLAPEVWSKPEKLLPDSMGQLPFSPFSLTTTGDTLLYGFQYVYFINKDSAGNWNGPKKLSPLYGLPNYSPDYPVLTPDKKTLYFTDLRSFRMYKCLYNDSTGEWGTPEVFYDNGFNVNPYWYCINFLNDSTMFVVGEERTRLARKHNGIWYPNYEYPKPGQGLFWINGIWVNHTGFRAYYALSVNQNLDIMLKYINEVDTSIYETRILNLSTMSDSLYQIGEYAGRSEYFPYLTADRRKMIFIANYDSVFKYYVSKLIIDENGDSVLTGTRKEASVNPPDGIELYQNFPNPFNPSTVIRFSVPQRAFVKLRIYDLLGRVIATPVNEEKTPGEYQVEFNGQGYASGIYFYELQAGDYRTVKTMQILK